MTDKSFIPYMPPNAGDGPLTVDRDIAWRITAESEKGLVTPAVIGAVAWAFSHFKITQADQKALLEGLGLEWFDKPMGGRGLQPRLIFRQPHYALLYGSKAFQVFRNTKQDRFLIIQKLDIDGTIYREEALSTSQGRQLLEGLGGPHQDDACRAIFTRLDANVRDKVARKRAGA